MVWDIESVHTFLCRVLSTISDTNIPPMPRMRNQLTYSLFNFPCSPPCHVSGFHGTFSSTPSHGKSIECIFFSYLITCSVAIVARSCIVPTPYSLPLVIFFFPMAPLWLDWELHFLVLAIFFEFNLSYKPTVSLCQNSITNCLYILNVVQSYGQLSPQLQCAIQFIQFNSQLSPQPHCAIVLQPIVSTINVLQLYSHQSSPSMCNSSIANCLHTRIFESGAQYGLRHGFWKQWESRQRSWLVYPAIARPLDEVERSLPQQR